MLNNRPFSAGDDQLWSDPFGQESDAFERAVVAKRVGVAIDAPRRVEIDRRTTLPLVGSLLLTRREEAVLSVGRTGIVVAVEQESGKCFVARARNPELLPDQDAPRVESGRRPCLPDVLVGICAPDFDLPWTPRSYLVTFLLRERMSNRVRVEVLQSVLAYRDTAVDESAPNHRPPLVPVWPPRLQGDAEMAPEYRQTSSSPEVPVGIGIALSVDRITVLGRDARCVVRGDFPPARAQSRTRGPRQRRPDRRRRGHRGRPDNARVDAGAVEPAEYRPTAPRAERGCFAAGQGGAARYWPFRTGSRYRARTARSPDVLPLRLRGGTRNGSPSRSRWWHRAGFVKRATE